MSNDYIMRCVIRKNEVMTLRRFCKSLNNDFIKEVRLIGVFTLDQAYTVAQDYKLFKKSRWTKYQDPLRILFRSQFRNNDFLLGAPPCKLNPSSAQIYNEDKRKRVINEMSRLSSEIQFVNCQGFSHVFFNCISKPLVIQKHKDIGVKKN